MRHRKIMPRHATRAYLYRVAGGVGALAAGYGIVEDVKLYLWLGLVSSLLGNGLATANTSTSSTAP